MDLKDVMDLINNFTDLITDFPDLLMDIKYSKTEILSPTLQESHHPALSSTSQLATLEDPATEEAGSPCEASPELERSPMFCCGPEGAMTFETKKRSLISNRALEVA